MPYFETAANWFYNNPCYTSMESHATIKNCANNCCYMYNETNNPVYLSKAFDYLEKASEYFEKMHAAMPDSLELAKIRLKYQNDCLCLIYVNLYIAEKKYTLADEYLEKFRLSKLEFERKSNTPLIADTATYHKNYAFLKYEAGEYEQAKKALESAYERYLCLFGKTARTINILETLIKCCIKLKDHEDANKYLSTAIEYASAVFTDNHPTLIRLSDFRREIAEIIT